MQRGTFAQVPELRAILSEVACSVCTNQLDTGCSLAKGAMQQGDFAQLPEAMWEALQSCRS